MKYKLDKSYGAAGTELRKRVIYHLAGKLGMLNCFRCKDEILDVADLSLDHKVPWRKAEDRVATFYDVENVAFSHLRCNSGSYLREKTHCDNGHPLTRSPSGERYCLICRRAKKKARRVHANEA